MQYVHLVGGTITKIHIHDSVFGLPGGMALDPWPLWQSNGTKNTYFQESSPESSPVQNPGPVQGIVLPVLKTPYEKKENGCGLGCG